MRRYDGPRGGGDWANALAVDNDGNVYVTGVSEGAFLVIKYNANGETLWVRRYDPNPDGWDEAFAIAVDNQGNVYITGRGFVDLDIYDYLTVKYGANGNQLWVVRYDHTPYWEIANHLAVDKEGNIYVTGRSDIDWEGLSDWATIKYIQRLPRINEKIIGKERIVSQEGIRFYNGIGKLVKEKRLKKGIYFQLTERGKKKILILK